MNNRPPRVAAIHALAGFGRSSLAVVIPTLSAMGVQVCPIPTAVMSTHTGGLGELVHRDLSDYIYPTVEHYQRLSVAALLVFSVIFLLTASLFAARQYTETDPTERRGYRAKHKK